MQNAQETLVADVTTAMNRLIAHEDDAEAHGGSIREAAAAAVDAALGGVGGLTGAVEAVRSLAVAASARADEALDVAGAARNAALDGTALLEKGVALGEIAGAASLDLTAGRVFSATVTGAVTITAETAPGVSLVLIVAGGDTHAVTWGMSPLWSGGMPPVLNGRDCVALTCGPDGVWYGALVSGDAR